MEAPASWNACFQVLALLLTGSPERHLWVPATHGGDPSVLPAPCCCRRQRWGALCLSHKHNNFISFCKTENTPCKPVEGKDRLSSVRNPPQGPWERPGSPSGMATSSCQMFPRPLPPRQASLHLSPSLAFTCIFQNADSWERKVWLCSAFPGALQSSRWAWAPTCCLALPPQLDSFTEGFYQVGDKAQRS